MSAQTPTGLGALLRVTRRKLKLTLRQVSASLAERGETLPPSTLSRIEQGKLDPSVRRLFLLLELYDVPAFVVSELVKQQVSLFCGAKAGQPAPVAHSPRDTQSKV